MARIHLMLTKDDDDVSVLGKMAASQSRPLPRSLSAN
jgi:hypothetical protein